MGQKANPIGLRLGINRTWDSLWFSKRDYARLVKEDIDIRKSLMSKLSGAGVARILIERSDKRPHVTVFASKPGVVIGKKGAGIEALLAGMKKDVGLDCTFNIVEVRKPELYAQIVADDIASQIKRRVFYKRAMKKAVQSALKTGASGIRVNCSGRLGGAEIARCEWYREGRVPLHTFRSDVDYGYSMAETSYGACGVKVWIYRGDVLGKNVALSERDLGGIAGKK
ncbi:30S ribosomal protein S3 [Candidatus Hydrogenosomobacter endosymbioticus]|uniref:Small ribosomal subunit protein uS3 n=1 Tax=Candidatus Hydrogenosomobacter endosymbioticus TaxID=2558174 RepID=A0ABM7V907_9PROT|nr:30S ribosomal protein S3 [Candidatus Hydrogenosomobacter endosymbioticus]BDB95946.1 30S ribosomal protein S3 [Candidatus Hydrogenosomobacter endosymbioticus]